ncbi:MAG: alternative ribosome rescue aminoacyl-tRNA hydrolase ArfB [Candidatus Krumholzibacteria bacterium]|nr:alternative ribosome rescue aminoacyl-tRNA hydrolase ArfB [Candidatus Krumholzibacteria bacterium]
MPTDLAIGSLLTIPAGELVVRASRAAGPGGQHVNTTDTRVQVRWNVPGSGALTPAQRERLSARLGTRLTAAGDLVIACDTHRSQRRNRQEALLRLAALVEQALHEPSERKPTCRTRAGHERRLARKRRRASIKRLRRDLPDD